MYIGNVMLLILNLPLVGLWAKMVRVPYHYVAIVILLFCFLGTYSVRNSFFDVGTCLAFGFIALIMERLSLPPLPFVISIILLPMLEDSMRQTTSIGGGSLAILRDRPIALVLIAMAILAVTLTLYARLRWSKAKAYLSADEEER
jgi:putative tricarboxylic transport membrane protein